MNDTPTESLRELARSHGIQLDYVDMAGQTRPASAESLLAVLRALGVSLSGPEDAAEALKARRIAPWRRRLEPVLIAWDGNGPHARLSWPAAIPVRRAECKLVTETGDERTWSLEISSATPTNIEGEVFLEARIPLPGPLPSGYHDLTVRFDDGVEVRSRVISAPSRAFAGANASGKRPWGLFCPLHALRKGTTAGAGDFSDLEALMSWTAELGGGLVATLPMLATNFDGPEPLVSPYSPTSRLFWNEFYVDLERIPELASCPSARAFLESAETIAEYEALRSSSLVQYGRQMRLKRRALELLAESFFAAGSPRSAAYEAFRAEHPEVDDYAFFQAAGEKFGRDWRNWPARLSGPERANEVDARARNYHLYAQWIADEQLRALSATAQAKGLAWYLDFPVGVDFNSFDVWRYRASFATGASVGCPPDPVFTRGQNWGFPPLHPDLQREDGYRYLIASFRNHFRYASALRIDHVMGLHRLFWIPEGREAKFGAFVSNPSEEIYAILSVESHRQGAWLVGEDLGTVPPEVEGALREHDVRGMYVIQYEMRPDPGQPLRPAPASTVASLNTHDMPPFAAYWQGFDIDDRVDLGLITPDLAETEKRTRAEQRAALQAYLTREGFLEPSATEHDLAAVVRGVSEWLAASPAGVVLLNLEDLWLETEPQNTPNTSTERPNWRKRIRRPIEDFTSDPALVAMLRRVNSLRTGEAR